MKILTTPHPFLRQTAKAVKSLDQKTITEIQNMITTLKTAKNPEGVGLAATQVGIDKQIFILLLNHKPHIFINPQIANKSPKMFSDVYKKSKDRWLEGCLSIPHIWGFVDRPYEVTLEYQTPNSLKIENCDLKIIQKEFSDIESAYVQHETDHLHGVLFTDHILKQNGQLFKEQNGQLNPITLV